MTTHDEKQIRRIISETWIEVLGLVELNDDDNVFLQGASSVYVARVHELLQERLDTAISIGTLLEHHSVSDLASYIIRAEPSTDSEKLSAVAADHAKRQRRRYEGQLQ